MTCPGPLTSHMTGVEECRRGPDFPPCPECNGTGFHPECAYLGLYGCLENGCSQVHREDCITHPCRACGGTGSVRCEECGEETL